MQAVEDSSMSSMLNYPESLHGGDSRGPERAARAYDTL